MLLYSRSDILLTFTTVNFEEHNVGNIILLDNNIKYDIKIIDTLNNIASTEQYFQYRPNSIVTNVTARSTIVR